jgi:hypothetical protein
MISKTVSRHKAPKQSPSHNEGRSMTADSELRNGGTVGIVNWSATWSHPESTEAVTICLDKCVNMGYHERSKSGTPMFRNKAILQ